MLELAIWLISAAVIVYFSLAALGILVNVFGDGRWKVAVATLIIFAACAVVHLYNHTHPVILLILGAGGLYLYVAHENERTRRELHGNVESRVMKPAKLDLTHGGDDEMYKEAVEYVASTGKASTALIQRKLNIGYARAARLIEEMEERGIVGAPEGTQPRKVLVSAEQASRVGRKT